MKINKLQIISIFLVVFIGVTCIFLFSIDKYCISHNLDKNNETICFDNEVEYLEYKEELKNKIIIKNQNSRVPDSLPVDILSSSS
jgi:hypothetical protein